MIASTPAGQKLFLKGYSTPGDGGEGTFTVLSGGSYTDDGGTIACAGGFGATEAKCAKRDYTGRLDSRWFGGVGDGATNDTTAAQRMLDSAATTGTPAHFARAGSGYSVGTLTLSDGVVVTGDKNTPLLQRTADAPVLSATSKSLVEIHGVKIVAKGGGTPGVSSTDVGIKLVGCTLSKVRDCHVVGFSGSGIRSENDPCVDISNNVVDGTGATMGPGCYGIYFVYNADTTGHARICENDVSNVGQGIIGGTASVVFLGNHIHDIVGDTAEHGTYIGADMISAVGNVVKNIQNGGLKFYPYTTTRDMGRFTVVGNTIDGGAGKTWTASFYYSLDDYIYTGGHLYRCTVAGTSGGGGAPAWPAGLGATVVDGGVTWKNIGTLALGQGSGIEFNGTSDFTHYAHNYLIQSNTVANMTGYGIAGSYKIHELKIRDNDIKDCGGSGIYTNAIALDHCDISGNTLVRCATVSAHAILVNPTAASEVDIRENLIDGTTAQGGASYNIYAANCTGLGIVGNRMIGVGGAKAVSVAGSSGVVVQRNDSDNLNTNGITTTALDGNSWGDTARAYLTTGIKGLAQQLTIDANHGTYTPGDATPDVNYGQVKSLDITNAAPTNITNLVNGTPGQEVTMHFNDGNTTVKRGASLKLAGGVDFVSAQFDVLKLFFTDGSVWVESGRATGNS